VKPFLVALSIPCALLVGCVDDREHEGHSDHHGQTLPRDAYYVGVPLPFRTAADCVAAGKVAAACTNEVALCASGAYGLRLADVVTAGRYQLEEHHAVSRADAHDDNNDGDNNDGENDDGENDDQDHQDGEHGGEAAARFDFDVEAGLLVGDPAGSTPLAWEPDYDGQWKTSAGSVIDCAARPPRG
jgi:hypothetical protein